MRAVLDACDARRTTADALRGSGHQRCVLSLGKAAWRMMQGLEDACGSVEHRMVVTSAGSPGVGERGVIESDHPWPTERSERAAGAVRAFLESARSREEARVTVLMSGGASALVAEPVNGLTIDDLREVTRLLITRGATIGELNTVRRAIDATKGGRLALFCEPMAIEVFGVSDVPGDVMSDIGSGPFVPSVTGVEEAAAVVDRYTSGEECGWVREVLNMMPRMERAREPGVSRVVLTNAAAVRAGAAALEREGIAVVSERSLAMKMSGVRASLVAAMNEIGPGEGLVWGGEWAIDRRINADGAGGRMQHLMASMLLEQPGIKGEGGWVMMGVGTDGVDGITPPGEVAAAGARVMWKSGEWVEGVSDEQKRHAVEGDSWSFFQRLDAVSMPMGWVHQMSNGPTGTNVNDVVVAWRPR